MGGISLFLFIFLQVTLYEKVRTQGQTEGESCKLTSEENGRCVHFSKCPEAITQIKNKKHPKICEFVKKDPIICCKSTELTTTSNDSIAEQRCQQYKGIESFIIVMNPTLVIGGESVIRLEFPHMAILGYGDEHDIKWQCGGSLISDKFVLTAAHCIQTKNGKVTYVMLGVHNLFLSHEDFRQSFKVKSTQEHPKRSPKTSYHDIALIELDRPASINPGVKPACLHTSKEIPNEILVATGWGAVELYEGITAVLQKADLKYVPFDSCSNSYRNDKRLPDGINDTNQICADGGGKRRDTCHGDSGGPLQIRRNNDKFYEIIGITSLGHSCGLIPAIYTRVSNYVPWIESIVWPN